LLLAGVNVASERLSTVFLSWVDTPAAVGLYSAAVFPITTLLLLPGIFYESIFPVFSEYHRASPAELRTSYRISYKLMLLLGFPMGAGIMLISRPLLVLMYGPDFEAAYVIMNILAVQLFAIVGYANGALLNATGREKLFAGLRTAFTLLNVVLSLVLIPRYSYVGAALAVSIPVLLDFFIYSYLSHRYIRLAYPWGTLARVAFSTLVMSAPAYLALRMGVNLFLVVSFAPFLYLVALLGFRAIDTDDWQIAKQIIPVKRGVT
jgi:O-antigen/teichoic acid export membrane protein